MMLAELGVLLAHASADASLAEHQHLVLDENLLGKGTFNGRVRSMRYLVNLYGLDPSVPIYRVLRELWDRDIAARPLLALSCALARDPLLRTSAPYVLGLQPGEVFSLDNVQQLYADVRFSDETRLGIAQHVAATWVQSGHLRGKTRKVRSRAVARPENVVYAMVLGTFEGRRGGLLLDTLWTRLLDVTPHELRELLQTASQSQLIDYRSAGGIVEIRLDGLVHEREAA